MCTFLWYSVMAIWLHAQYKFDAKEIYRAASYPIGGSFISIHRIITSEQSQAWLSMTTVCTTQFSGKKYRAVTHIQRVRRTKAEHLSVVSSTNLGVKYSAIAEIQPRKMVGWTLFDGFSAKRSCTRYFGRNISRQRFHNRKKFEQKPTTTNIRFTNRHRSIWESYSYKEISLKLLIYLRRSISQSILHLRPIFILVT